MKTFNHQIQDLKNQFQGGNVPAKTIAIECWDMIETILIENIFHNFHAYLRTPQERKIWLDCENSLGEKYESSTMDEKPGKAIGWYAEIVHKFPDHVLIDPGILSDLNLVKHNRNWAAHPRNHPRPISEDEAYESLDSTITIITKLNMLKHESTNVTGIPIHLYLVFSSIKEKFSLNNSSDFDKMISDSKILLPEVMNLTINKLYSNKFDKEQKKKLVEIFLNNGDCELDFKACVEAFSELDIFTFFGKKEIPKIKKAFEKIPELENIDLRVATKFDLIPYFNLMTILINHLSKGKPDAENYFQLADSIKRNYLNDNQISEREDFALRETARTLGIEETYNIFKRKVIKEIEEHLIKYRTFGPASSDNSDSEVEKNLINMIKLGTPFEAVQALASQLGYTGKIERLFSEHRPENIQSAIDVHQPVASDTSIKSTPVSRGKKIPAYEQIRKAMESFRDDYIASYGDIMDYCNKAYGETKKSTFRTYIISCTVNHDTRVHYHPNKKPRTELDDNDVLFKVEKGKVVLYEPDKHGKWIIRYNEDHKLIIEKE